MKTLQVFGFGLAVLAFCMAALLLGGLPPRASASQAGAAGLGLMFIAGPVLGLAALMLVPSSLVLLWPRMRQRFGIRGVWMVLWCINTAAVFGALALAGFVAWLALTMPAR